MLNKKFPSEFQAVFMLIRCDKTCQVPIKSRNELKANPVVYPEMFEMRSVTNSM